MENNLSQRVDEVLNQKAHQPQSAPTQSAPLRPVHKEYFRKPLYIVAMLIILLIILSAVFTLLNVGMFKKKEPYVKDTMSQEEYTVFVEELKDSGFFDVPSVDPKKLKEIQDQYQNSGYLNSQTDSNGDRNSVLQENGTVGIIQEK
jgi:uncharacterized protein YxeA